MITPPATVPPNGVTFTLYDTHGNELYDTTGVFEPGSTTAAYSQTTYQLFKGNSVTLNGHTITCTAVPPSAALPCATINPNGVVTQLAYNSAGDLTSTSTPDGNGTELATTTYTYDADGEQQTEVSPDGNLTGANAGNYTTTTTYNANGDEATVTQGNGTGFTDTPRITATYGYDSNGNRTTVKDARGFTTTTTYTADNRPTVVTDPDGNATLTCYDSNGFVAQTVPPAGVAANSLTAASCPTVYPAGYTNRLASDATTTTFDALGQKTAVTTPAPAGQTGSETTTYAYDGAGNVVTYDRSGHDHGRTGAGDHEHLQRRRPAGDADHGIRHLSRVHRRLLLRPERRHDLGRAWRRRHWRHGDLRDLGALRGVGHLLPDRGRLPDDLLLRLGRRAGLYDRARDLGGAVGRDNQLHL